MTRAPGGVRPAHASRALLGAHANDFLAGVLVALVLLAWVLSWRGVLGAAWPHALLVQAGKFSYALLALTATLGPLIGTRLMPRWLSAAAKAGWHGVASGFALATGLIHAAFTLVGGERLTLTEVLLPGAASGATFALAAGSAGLWLAAFVYVTYALRRRIGGRAARALHLLAYPAFLAVTLHAVWLGRADALYVLGAAAVAFALAARLLTLARR